jgi:hypothetical protein
VRYYFCSDGNLAWRIPDRLHRALIAGEVLLPQFAGTRRKVLEVFFRNTPSGKILLDARGSFYNFDPKGRLDVLPVSEAWAGWLEGSRPRRLQERVIDIGPTLRYRRRVTEQFWHPAAGLLRSVRADLRASAVSDPGRVPRLTQRVAES